MWSIGVWIWNEIYQTLCPFIYWLLIKVREYPTRSHRWRYNSVTPPHTLIFILCRLYYLSRAVGALRQLFWSILSTLCCRHGPCCKSFHVFFFFFRTTYPMLTQFGSQQPLVKTVQACSHLGPCSFQRKHNSNYQNYNGNFLLQNNWTSYNQIFERSANKFIQMRVVVKWLTLPIRR